jgi:PAS domain S-box-containing protein
VVRDITESKRAEEVIKESEEKYRNLFTNMSEGFGLHEIIVDAGGKPCDYRFLDVNPAFERLTGLKGTDVLGKRVLEVLPGTEGHWIENYGKVALTGEPVRFENFSTSLDRWYEVFAYRPAPDQFAVVFTDVTLRKRAEEALQQRTLELQHLSETLEERVKARTEELAHLSSQLVSAQEDERRRVSYDLHDNVWQMLVAIRFGIENLFSGQEDWGALRNKSKQVMTDILGLVGKIRSMQGDLWPYVLDDIGLAATIDWYCREFGKNHSGLVIEMKNEIMDREIPSSAKIVIYRILQETLDNVAKHSQAGRVTLHLMKRDHGMEFNVEDNGIGFDPEETIVKRAPWSGLGLLSIKARTELSGGIFGVESAKGKGTIIRASWPV